MSEPIQIINSRVRWAKHGSKGKRAGPAHSYSHSKPKTYQKLLAEQAMALGWLNGKRIRKLRP